MPQSGDLWKFIVIFGWNFPLQYSGQFSWFKEFSDSFKGRKFLLKNEKIPTINFPFLWKSFPVKSTISKILIPQSSLWIPKLNMVVHVTAYHKKHKNILIHELKFIVEQTKKLFLINMCNFCISGLSVFLLIFQIFLPESWPIFLMEKLSLSPKFKFDVSTIFYFHSNVYKFDKLPDDVALKFPYKSTTSGNFRHEKKVNLNFSHFFPTLCKTLGAFINFVTSK